MMTWPENLLAAIPVFLRQRRLVLGFSGGLDSTLLLHGLAALRGQGLLGDVLAVHVHHGLLPQADDWADKAARLCASLDVPFQLVRVQVQRGGAGLEAAAREARYAALTRVMQAGDGLLTAHHQDDQAETFLLQLMRGAGVRGLAAMPALAPLECADGAAWHVRPLLHMPRAYLQELALARGLTWVEDPSNQDVRLARNLLRHSVLPHLQTHWPQAVQTLSRCAQRMASTEGLLLDLARLDLQAARSDMPERLQVSALLALSPVRLHNALRAWLLELGLSSPPQARLEEVSRLLVAREDALPCITWPGGVLRRWRACLVAMKGDEAQDEVEVSSEQVFGAPWSLHQALDIPALGVRLVAHKALGQGLRASDVAEEVWVCTRHEAVLPPSASRARLGKRLQQAGIAPWERGRALLLYRQEKLLGIAGHRLAPDACAAEGEAGWLIAVEPLSPACHNPP